MTVAVCLTTCGRYDYTKRTLETFAAFNDLSRFVLLHGDDGSPDRKGMSKLARRHGFATVVENRTRQGWLPTRRALVLRAARVADWVLILENDIESIRPFPWPLLRFVAARPSLYCLRLFGEFKGPNRTDPCKTTHQWKGNRQVVWKPLHGAPEPAQMASIHWTAQPSVTRSRELVALHRDGIKELRMKTARVVSNVTIHIGAERTPPLEVAC